MDLKRELRETAIQITCYDRNGEIVRRVTSVYMVIQKCTT